MATAGLSTGTASGAPPCATPAGRHRIRPCPKPWEQIFDDITGGSRAESRARRGMPADELNEWYTPALVLGNDAQSIVDAELFKPEPDRTPRPPSSNAERASNAGRGT